MNIQRLIWVVQITLSSYLGLREIKFCIVQYILGFGIMDNAAFHVKEVIRDIAETLGHRVLFLPPYSPDLNPIEKVFAILKKRRRYAPSNTPIDQIEKECGLFLEYL